MARIVGGIALAAVVAALGGCTSVKMVQRDGCWVRRTEKIFGRVVEEVGPCARPQPEWAQDRLTRVVQECVAQADYRWQGRAMEAWSRGLPFPPQPAQEETVRGCMEETRTGLVAENELLKQRLGEIATDRDAFRSGSERDRAQLRASHDRIADALGEAAKKPAGTAYASSSSTSDGKATNESGSTLAAGAPAGPAPAPAAPPASTAPAQSPPGASTTPVTTEAPAIPGAPTAAPVAKRAAPGAEPRARRASPAPAQRAPACGTPACAPSAGAGGDATPQPAPPAERR